MRIVGLCQTDFSNQYLNKALTVATGLSEKRETSTYSVSAGSQYLEVRQTQVTCMSIAGYFAPNSWLQPSRLQFFPNLFVLLGARLRLQSITFNSTFGETETTHHHLMISCRHGLSFYSEKTLRNVCEFHSCRPGMVLNFWKEICKSNLHDHIDARYS